MNEVNTRGNYAEISSHIDETAISMLENVKREFEWIQFYSAEPNVQDLKVLNEYFKQHPKVYLRWIESSWIEHLPDLKMYSWSRFNQANMEFIKDRLVKGLAFEHEPEKQSDFSIVANFKDTLEELSFEGNAKNTEQVLEQLKQLKKLHMTSVKLKNLSFFENLKVEDFYYYGSKISDWNDLAKAKMLRKFMLKTNTNLENIDFITQLENLEELEFWYVSKLVRFPNCEHLKKLKSVLLYECNRLSEIEELKKLKNVHIHADGKAVPNLYYEAN